MAPIPALHPSLQPINPSTHTFRIPSKQIHSRDDLIGFEGSEAYVKILAFLTHLNASVSPLALSSIQEPATTSSFPTTPGVPPATFAKPAITPDKLYTNSSTIEVSPAVQGIIDLLRALESLVSECPPSTGPRRFGNVSFRTWHKLTTDRLPTLLLQHLPAPLNTPSATHPTLNAELTSYLLGSFGSPQRLDYGTGHELSFLAFLLSLWLLGVFVPGRDEQALVLRGFSAYLHLIRALVRTYTLEPAGSHGVWGLDDHSFLPYVFGSAQLTTHAPRPGFEPDYAAIGVPAPGDVTKIAVVREWRDRNMYFDALAFIYEVKKGAFWEHSPILFDISGVKEGWGKINIGMIKMYKAEVLGKFPVVQHFLFGSLFPWTPYETSTAEAEGGPTTPTTKQSVQPTTMASTAAPWAAANQTSMAQERDRFIGAGEAQVAAGLRGPVDTVAPWRTERRGPQPPPPSSSSSPSGAENAGVTTRAPWAR